VFLCLRREVVKKALFLFAFLAAANIQAATPEQPITVRYQAEYREAGGVVLHFSELLNSGDISSISCMRGYDVQVPGCVLYRKLLEVRGIEEMTINRYQLEIKADVLFSWNDVITGVVKVVQDYLRAKEMKAEPPIMPVDKERELRNACRSLAFLAATR
jgi:hypothetical protein